ncbi:MAG TPA: hypothetical protein VFY73_10450 [Ideonella sp.]|uniref:hypothetical protein n=1 Tax=Ideonella sp. TaxID=1929293 RepID=UPI002E313AC0|nr:hypothetical protein [Ideonella sp.]HEX5684439.1 hypothetical protein [Ideonella sp.]
MHARPSPWRWLGWALLIGTLAIALVTVVSLVTMFNHLPPDLLITVDGEQIELGGLEAGHAWLAFGAIVLAMVIVVIVVPLALLFGVGLPLLMVALGVVAALLCAALAVAVVGSPVILLGLLLWWAVRPKKKTTGAPAAPAAPPPVPVIGQHTDNSTPFAQ